MPGAIAVQLCRLILTNTTILAAITPALTRLRANLRLPESAQTRKEELARKSEEGTMSIPEREEYDALVSAGNFIAILQSKAYRGSSKTARPDGCRSALGIRKLLVRQGEGFGHQRRTLRSGALGLELALDVDVAGYFLNDPRVL